jgi:hypothetical protein
MKTLLLSIVFGLSNAQAGTDLHKPADVRLTDVNSCSVINDQGQNKIKQIALRDEGLAKVWVGSLSITEGHFVIYLSQQVSPGLTGRSLTRVYQFSSEAARDQLNFSEIVWISQDSLSVGEFVDRTVSASRILTSQGLGHDLQPYTILCESN